MRAFVVYVFGVFNIILCSTCFAFAQVDSNPTATSKIAHTTDGEKVFLLADGTWISADSLNSITASSKKVKPYFDTKIKAEFVNANAFKDDKTAEISIGVAITVIQPGLLVRPKTHKIYGYTDASPNDGGTYPYGAGLEDVFGNEYPLKAIYPAHYSNRQPALRAGEKKMFIITFADTPPQEFEFLFLKIQKSVFGNVDSFTLEIPSSALLKAENN